MKKEVLILGVIAAIVIGAGIWLAVSSAPKPLGVGQAIDPKALIRTHSRMTGKIDSTVTLVEFGDYQCPACGAAHPVIKQLLKDYEGKSINFVFRNFPLPMHGNAFLAAEAAESAGKQNKFWEMHDKLYENQNQWAESTTAKDIFISYAGDIGLNTDQFTQDLNRRSFQDIINKDMEDGNKLGVDATPTFYLNGEKWTKGYKLDEFKKAIDGLLSKQPTVPAEATTTP